MESKELMSYTPKPVDWHMKQKLSDLLVCSGIE